MNSFTMEIWGRQFDLDIVFESLDGDQYSKEQLFALASFLVKKEIIELSRSSVEKYVVDNARGNEIDNPVSNIFKYVIPTCIFVSKVREGVREVSLMCNFKFDMEHGIAVIFKNEQLDKVGEQGIVL